MFLNGVLIALFIEGLLLIPVVIIVASLSKPSRTLRYIVPDFLALAPYLIVKLTRSDIRRIQFRSVVILPAIVVAVCFLVYFTGLTLVSCAGHPPY